ncbi:Capsular polysaccharide type 8 biosynthesis protein cap8A [Clostridium formicaceticum]|uniref:Capsular polysaccharide type 8 biosynthesis protein cap8A n=2 Tax=Clostridium formicaceticum TaxID=1497 RepID=A0AAC9WER7_9CLOT|nr:hypothetical protein BJL90_06640 [Clostridium formicaceticum]ARE85904.1 Capsular polysaccharide type 8 biosynthesis protein cap8A [Clostridium formicaceticum]
MELELDLREYIHIIQKRFWLIVIITVLAMLTSGVISYYVLDPIYQASTTIMVGKPQSESELGQLQLQDLNLNLRLAKTYGEIVKSRSVSQEVIREMNLDLTPEQLTSKTTVDLVRDTEFITIKVTDTDPQLAADIANNLSKTFKKYVMQIMRVDNVQVLDAAVVPMSPIKPRKQLNIAIAGVLGLMFSLFLVFLMEYLDNTIKTPEDIQRHLNLNIIGAIPAMREED